jgi:hypothetical protein
MKEYLIHFTQCSYGQAYVLKAHRTPWATQNDPQNEFPIKKAWRTWREIKKRNFARDQKRGNNQGLTTIL